MKRNWIMACLVLIAANCLTPAANAQKTVYDANAQERTVGSFLGISVSGAIDLYLSMGNEAVAVSAREPSIVEKIITEVRNGILYIEFREKGLANWQGRNMKAYVSVKSISRIMAAGTSQVHVDGSLNAPDLLIDISGASDFSGAVDVQTLRLNGSGSSDFHISGKAINLKINLVGASDLKGFDLMSDVCDVEASGSSDVKISVAKELRAKANGSSNIRYKGDPIVKDTQKGGSSDVKKVSG